MHHFNPICHDATYQTKPRNGPQQLCAACVVYCRPQHREVRLSSLPATDDGNQRTDQPSSQISAGKPAARPTTLAVCAVSNLAGAILFPRFFAAAAACSSFTVRRSFLLLRLRPLLQSPWPSWLLLLLVVVVVDGGGFLPDLWNVLPPPRPRYRPTSRGTDRLERDRGDDNGHAYWDNYGRRWPIFGLKHVEKQEFILPHTYQLRIHNHFFRIYPTVRRNE